MVDAWPFPTKLLQRGFSEGLADNLVEDQTDAGPPMSRPRSSAGVEPLAGTVIVSGAEKEALKTFVKVTLAQGSLPFSFPAPRSGATLLVRFQKGKLPTFTELGGDRYLAAISLWVLP